MKSFTVVENLDVFKGGRLHLVMRVVTHAMQTFILETVKPALGRRAVPAVALPAHGTDHAVLFEPGLEGMAGILTAAIRMMQQSRLWPLAKPGHRQRIGDHVSAHARLDRPAYDLSVEQVHHNGQIQPALLSPQIGQIRCPHLVRRAGARTCASDDWPPREGYVWSQS